jgi:hypothetical protein
MEKQPFIHDLGKGKRTLEAKRRPLSFFDEVSSYDSSSWPMQKGFHEGPLEPLCGVENTVLTTGRIEAIPRCLAWARSEKDGALSLSMDADNDLSRIELQRQQARGKARCRRKGRGQTYSSSTSR